MEEYTRGFDVTQNLQYQAHQCVIDAYEMGLKNGIEQGRNEAWEAARKLRLSRVNDPNMAELRDIFGVSVLDSDTDILRKFSASEVIEKIKSWEEKKVEDDNIEIGDEVYVADKDYRKVVIDIIDNRSCRCLSFTGISVYLIEDLHKTGRHFTEISEILEKMKNGE